MRKIAASRQLDGNRYVFSTDINLSYLESVRALTIGDVEVEKIGVRELLHRKSSRRARRKLLIRQNAAPQSHFIVGGQCVP